MKFAIAFVAACTFAGGLGVPVSGRGDAGSVTASGKASTANIEDLVGSRCDLVREIEATGCFESTNGGLRSPMGELQESPNGPSSGPLDAGEFGTKEWLAQRIAEIREAIASSTAELASIIWQQANGKEISESLATARQTVLRRLADLKNELLVRIREMMIPDDDVPVPYIIDEVFEQVIAGLKNQISDALQVITNWHNLLTDTGRAKIATAKKSITEWTQKIADTVREWKRAKESNSTRERFNYASDPSRKDKFILKLQRLLEEFKTQVELKELEVAKSSAGHEQETLVHLREVNAQLSTSSESIQKMIGAVARVEVASPNIVARLRDLLYLKLEELQELKRGCTDGEKIRLLEKEVVNLRRKLIDVIRDAFQKP